MLFKPNSIKDIFIHLGIIAGISFVLILLFFFAYLPSTTNHGETTTVPNLLGRDIEEINESLAKRNFRFEVTADSGFSSEYPPLAVLKQYPEAGSKVKENRKIYLSLNAQKAPMVKMPRLIDASVKNAEMTLQSYGLVIGKIKYVPHIFQNAILEQLHEGKEVKAGEYIPKGSTIDLVAGDGLGAAFETPDLTGMELEQAIFIIEGSGLKVGSLLYSENTTEAPRSGIIWKQSPSAGERVRAGELIDLWIRETDTQIFDNEEANNTTEDEN